MDISRQKVLDVSFAPVQWMASAKGLTTARSITLDVSKFTANTHYPNGRLKSGLYLGLVTASSKYGPYDDAATDGRQTAVGFLVADVPVAYAAGVAQTAVPVAGALLWEGVVSKAAIQTINGNTALDANGLADLASKFLFVA